jgi:hypothetical protein
MVVALSPQAASFFCWGSVRNMDVADGLNAVESVAGRVLLLHQFLLLGNGPARSTPDSGEKRP